MFQTIFKYNPNESYVCEEMQLILPNSLNFQRTTARYGEKHDGAIAVRNGHLVSVSKGMAKK